MGCGATVDRQERIRASVAFVEALARRMAATMPHSIDLGDLVQDGMIGLIDAANRFDERRGIKFETFAERRVRGAMIDALRRDAWPRGVRRVRREIEAAREALRRELGCEPSLAELAARVGADAARLERTIVRIHTIESTSPLATADDVRDAQLPPVLVPAEPLAPDKAYEVQELRERVRAAIAALPPRERAIITRYYYGEETMKQIGLRIGVNESRVSQLHARALERLRRVLGADLAPALMAARAAVGRGGGRWQMAKASWPAEGASPAQPSASRAACSSSANRNGFASQRQPLSSRKRAASGPIRSPVTKTIRRASAGASAAAAR
jgi:RNA polymerase sigma factor for flagellar operon FliA